MTLILTIYLYASPNCIIIFLIFTGSLHIRNILSKLKIKFNLNIVKFNSHYHAYNARKGISIYFIQKIQTIEPDNRHNEPKHTHINIIVQRIHPGGSCKLILESRKTTKIYAFGGALWKSATSSTAVHQREITEKYALPEPCPVLWCLHRLPMSCGPFRESFSLCAADLRRFIDDLLHGSMKWRKIRVRIVRALVTSRWALSKAFGVVGADDGG